MKLKVLCLALCVSFFAGCSAQVMEVRQKWKFGPEFRETGSQTHNERWTIQTGLEAKWDNGVKTGITYRRRDVNDGDGSHDNGVWFELSYPLWKRPK